VTDTEEAISCEQARAILALPLRQPNDAEAATVRDYLVKLLQLVWKEGECFDGKRPFGNSSWEYDLYDALVAGGVVSAILDSDGNIDDFGWDQQELANRLIEAAIAEFLHPQLDRSEEVAILKAKLAKANIYHPSGNCRICGRREGST
jgi:hypothetical protein